ncbi:MAG: glycosyltransferase, partial [Candidatus Dormibacteraeota bacterium]|nr:glycosyltransferase [Candidatus Dormibacteraeota bacterium]
WVYHRDDYAGRGPSLAAAAARVVQPILKSWDQRAARSATRYVTSSANIRQQIRDVYGLEPEVVPPPAALLPGGSETAVEGTQPGYLLCVSRLLPYKHVDAVAGAMRALPAERLVIVGDGPEASSLATTVPANVTLLGAVSDAQLRWLYRNADALVAASYEDYGITPLEAAAFGKPSVVLRQGGFLDTVVEGETGVFFDTPEAEAIAVALRAMRTARFEPAAIAAHAAGFSEARFIARLRDIVDEVTAA